MTPTASPGTALWGPLDECRRHIAQEHPRGPPGCYRGIILASRALHGAIHEKGPSSRGLSLRRRAFFARLELDVVDDDAPEIPTRISGTH